MLVSLNTAQSCKAGLWWWDELGTWIVSYNESPCDDSIPLYFCEDSGWGNKEATVVCRKLGYLYGIGSKCIDKIPDYGLLGIRMYYSVEYQLYHNNGCLHFQRVC